MAENEQTTTPEPKGDDLAALKKALEAERKARREAEKAAREATDQLTALQSQALRAKVAAAKGLTEAQAEFLTGSTEEEMTAAADKLLESFKPDKADRATPAPGSRPREALTPGASNPDDQASDFAALADKIAG